MVRPRHFASTLASSAMLACGVRPIEPTAGDASTGTSTASGGEASTDGGPCTADDDCPGTLVCDGGACTGCTANEQCPGAQLCDGGVCVDRERLPACEQVAGSHCGDAIIDAIEECDGTPGCDACRSTDEPTQWLHAEGLTRLVPAADGGAHALGGGYEGNASLLRYAADASVAWSQPVANDAFDLAVDVDATAYVVGTIAIDPAPNRAPWIAAWDADGALSWSIEGDAEGGFWTVAADATRVVAGGSLGAGALETRALLRQHDRDGAQTWMLDEPMLYSIQSVALIGDEVAATAWSLRALDGVDEPQLLRVDAAGTLRWVVALPDDGDPQGMQPKHVVGDGSGGTWSFGGVDGGPWAARHDGEGNELERLDCIGHAAGWIEHFAVGPAGQLAMGVFASASPPARPTTAWIAIAQGGAITRARTFEGSSEVASSLAVGWRGDGSLVAGWTESFDVGSVNRVVVLPP